MQLRPGVAALPAGEKMCRLTLGPGVAALLAEEKICQLMFKILPLKTDGSKGR
jgi:hypothetical protein